MFSPFTWLSPADYRDFRTAEVPADTSVNSFVACWVRSQTANIYDTENKGRSTEFVLRFAVGLETCI